VIEVPTGPIMPQHVDGLTNLVASGRGINSLDGLECLNDLVVLDLSSNALTDISPLKFLPALSSLDLTFNQVSDLAALSGAPYLSQLKLLSNAITNLSPLVTNQAIGTGDLVDLSGNPIDCELQGANITTLENRGVILGTDCGGGPTNCTTGPLTFADQGLEDAVRDAINKPVGVLVPSDVASLTLLDASGTGITSVEGIQCLMQLQSLLLSANSVTELSPLRYLTNLAYLDLDSNGIVDISPLAFLTKLDELSLNGNQVFDVSPLSALPQLSLLDLTGNEIQNLSPLAQNQGLGDGDLVGVQQNPLSCSSAYDSISQLTSRGVDVSTDCLYTVTDCETGPLTFVDPVLESAVRIAINRSEGDIMPNDVSELSYLSTGSEEGTGVGVYSLEGLQCLQALNTLDLKNNFIQNLQPVSALGQLNQLDLTNNEINDVGPLASLALLHRLYLSRNSLIDLAPLGVMTGLDELALQQNQILDLSPLAGNENLNEGDYVYLTGNPFDCQEQSSNISLLENRYVFVDSDCGPPPIDF
jgi:Leucine-rich repeat (LRR) protein